MPTITKLILNLFFLKLILNWMRLKIGLLSLQFLQFILEQRNVGMCHIVPWNSIKDNPNPNSRSSP